MNKMMTARCFAAMANSHPGQEQIRALKAKVRQFEMEKNTVKEAMGIALQSKMH